MRPHRHTTESFPLTRSLPCCLLVLMLLGTPLSAAPTSPQQAEKAVRGWLKPGGPRLGMRLAADVAGVQSFSEADGGVLYYVVSLKPQGFIVVAADDLAEPIVAFAAEGRYDPSLSKPLGALVNADLAKRISLARRNQALMCAWPP